MTSANFIRALLPDGSLPAESRAHVDAQVDARVAQQVPAAVTAEAAQQIPPIVEAAVPDAVAPHVAEVTSLRDQTAAIRDDVQVISGLTGEDQAVAYLHADPESKTGATVRRAHAGVVAPLTLPVFDEATNPNWRRLTHPDVLYFENGWNGWRYWMTYTPIPDGREAPHVAVSQDGGNWQLPPGGPLPVSPYSELDPGFNYFSDSDLVMLDDATMAMYYRATSYDGPGRLYRKTTTDGITWSPPQTLMDYPSSTLASPALVREADGTFTMWSINMDAPALQRTERRTSPDGVTWSAPTTCAIAATGWGEKHIDVIRDGGTYHALIMTSASLLYYGRSTDGINWATNTSPVRPSGTQWDNSGHYRSTLIKSPNSPGRFDVFLAAAVPDNPALLQRILLVRGMALDIPAAAGASVWVAADRFHASTGTPTMATQTGNNFRGWSMPDTGTSQINALVNIPSDWERYSADLYWANATSQAGGVRLEVKRDRFGPAGETLTLPGVSGAGTVDAPAANNTLQVADALLPNAVRDTEIAHIKVLRRGDDPADDKTGAVLLLGVMLRKIS